jgi:hypothetical protein
VVLLALALAGAGATLAVRGGGQRVTSPPPAVAAAPIVPVPQVAAPPVAPPQTAARSPKTSRAPARTRAPRRSTPRRTARRRAAAPKASAARAPAPRWRSLAVGRPNDGRLVDGVELPAGNTDYFTWDFPFGTSPSRPWRRWATDRLVTFLPAFIKAFRARHPGAPRIGIADLSLPRGGPFGGQYGSLGHVSHQNGLDVDVLYPRTDRAEAAPGRPSDVDRGLAQALVDTFVAAGVQFVFVGQHLGLRGPPAVVQAIPHHDDHMHVRIPG